MKDSQQMSVDISSQNDMALKALQPVSLKDSNIYPVDSISDDLGDESFGLQLSDDEDDERHVRKESSISVITHETEDDILNKFDTPETEGVITNGCSESDELEDNLLNDVTDTKENETVVVNGDCANLDEQNDSDSDLRNKESDNVISDNADKHETQKEEIIKTKDDEITETEDDELTETKDELTETKDDEITETKDCEVGETKDETIEIKHAETECDEAKVEEAMETNDDEGVQNKDEQPLENEAEVETNNEEAMETNDKETEESTDAEAAEEKEKANAVLLKDQIMDTEDLLKIVDQQDTEETNDTTPDKEFSDEAELESNDIETDKNEDDEDNRMSKTDDDDGGDGVDIEEESSYRNDFDNSELDKEYQKIVDEKDNESSDTFDKEKDEFETETEISIPEKMDVDESDKPSKEDNEMESEKSNDGIADEGVTPSLNDPSTNIDTSTDNDVLTDIDVPTDIDVATENDKVTTNTDTTIDMDATKKKDDANKGVVTDSEVVKDKVNEEQDKTNRAEVASADSKTVTESVAAKRTLSESEITSDPKRLRLDEAVLDVDEKDKTPKEPDEPPKIVALNAISEYMQKKNLTKLTRQDLEQICLLKMCEAICHKSEIGELRHQLGVQEQMIDMWRKEAAQLTKQARDLEIVNKRLLHEVRLKNDRDKPLIPVKITRSVGLQVRSDNNAINNVMNQKRRFTRPQPTTTTPSKPITTTASSAKLNSTPTPQKQPNRYQTKPVSQSPTNKSLSNKVPISPVSKTPTPIKPKTIATKSPSSLLSKALQNSAAQAANALPSTASNNVTAPPLASISSTSTTTTTSVTSKANSSPKTTKATAESKAFIDLTDEDEKRPAPTSTTTTTTVNGTTTPGVRIVSTPVKNASVSSSGVVNPPRIMYVYNNQLHQGLLATDSTKLGTQKLMLKLNPNVMSPTNGVLTAVTNGSTISVSNAAIRTNQQVQPVRLSTPVTTVRTTPAAKATVVKHPAPLPPPPLTQMGLAARKPIPPKPHLSIRRSSGGIVLSWKMPYNLDSYEAIASYQLYAYQETTSPPSSDMWRKVGDVKALALPMACTLTQFADGNKYHFAVRAVDVQKRMGPFSDPEQILL